MKRFLAGTLCLLLCVGLLAACTKEKPVDTPTGEDTTKNTLAVDPDTSAQETDEVPETKETAEVPETDDTADTEELPETDDTADTEDAPETEEPDTSVPEFSEDDIAASLVGVRQGMIGTPSMMASAYLGATDSAEAQNVTVWINSLLPGFLSNLPFISAIDDAHVIGDRYGEAYLVLPCDENASVSINRVDENAVVTEVLYRSESGDPVIVFANNSGYTSDVQVNIVDSNGNVMTWYPTLNDRSFLSQPSDLSVLDITPYEEAMTREYNELQQYSWMKPSKIDLVDTSWDTVHYTADGSEVKYHMNFTGDKVYIQWDEEILEADWSIVTEDSVCKLKLSSDTLTERSYNLLIATLEDYLYISQDLSVGAMYGDELISAMMERTYG